MTTFEHPHRNRLTPALVAGALALDPAIVEETPDGRILILDADTADVRELTETEYARCQRARIARAYRAGTSHA
jgi:type IV secretory pathway VirB9-like protein